MEPSDGDKSACGRGRRERGVVLVTLTEPGEELGDVGLPDVLGTLDPHRREVCRPPGQVPTVCRERVPGDTPLDVEVGEPGVDGPAHGGGTGRRLCGTCRQERASSIVMLSMPNASATAAYVTCPAWVLRPPASALSAFMAPFQPDSASVVA